MTLIFWFVFTHEFYLFELFLFVYMCVCVTSFLEELFCLVGTGPQLDMGNSLNLSLLDLLDVYSS